MKKLSILASFLVLTAVARFVVADAARDDAAQIQGTWLIDRFGKDKFGVMPDAELMKATMVIDAEKMTMYGKNGDGGSGEPVDYVLDASKTPGWCDLFPPDASELTIPGIYKLEGDTLTLVWADPKGVRPTNFVLGPGQGSMLMVLKRAGVVTTRPSTRPSTQPTTKP